MLGKARNISTSDLYSHSISAASTNSDGAKCEHEPAPTLESTEMASSTLKDPRKRRADQNRRRGPPSTIQVALKAGLGKRSRVGLSNLATSLILIDIRGCLSCFRYRSLNLFDRSPVVIPPAGIAA